MAEVQEDTITRTTEDGKTKVAIKEAMRLEPKDTVWKLDPAAQDAEADIYEFNGNAQRNLAQGGKNTNIMRGGIRGGADVGIRHLKDPTITDPDYIAALASINSQLDISNLANEVKNLVTPEAINAFIAKNRVDDFFNVHGKDNFLITDGLPADIFADDRYTRDKNGNINGFKYYHELTEKNGGVDVIRASGRIYAITGGGDDVVVAMPNPAISLRDQSTFALLEGGDDFIFTLGYGDYVNAGLGDNIIMVAHHSDIAGITRNHYFAEAGNTQFEGDLHNAKITATGPGYASIRGNLTGADIDLSGGTVMENGEPVTKPLNAVIEGAIVNTTIAITNGGDLIINSPIINTHIESDGMLSAQSNVTSSTINSTGSDKIDIWGNVSDSNFVATGPIIIRSNVTNSTITTRDSNVNIAGSAINTIIETFGNTRLSVEGDFDISSAVRYTGNLELAGRIANSSLSINAIPLVPYTDLTVQRVSIPGKSGSSTILADQIITNLEVSEKNSLHSELYKATVSYSDLTLSKMVKTKYTFTDSNNQTIHQGTMVSRINTINWRGIGRDTMPAGAEKITGDLSYGIDTLTITEQRSLLDPDNSSEKYDPATGIGPYNGSIKIQVLRTYPLVGFDTSGVQVPNTVEGEVQVTWTVGGQVMGDYRLSGVNTVSTALVNADGTPQLENDGSVKMKNDSVQAIYLMPNHTKEITRTK